MSNLVAAVHENSSWRAASGFDAAREVCVDIAIEDVGAIFVSINVNKPRMVMQIASDGSEGFNGLMCRAGEIAA